MEGKQRGARRARARVSSQVGWWAMWVGKCGGLSLRLRVRVRVRVRVRANPKPNPNQARRARAC